MKKYKMIIFFIGWIMIISPSILVADDTHINVNIDPKGASDETIKIREHELKTKEYLEDKQKAEKIKQSDDYCRTADMYYSKGELGMAAEYYQKAIDANENNVGAHESLLKVQRQFDDIEAMTGDHYHKAMEYLRMGLKQKAVDELVLELKSNPANEEARMRLNEIEAK